MIPDFPCWASQQGRNLATSGGNKKKFRLGQSYSYIMRKVWYHQIWIQNNLGFIVLILMYVPVTLQLHSPYWHVLWRKLANICTTVLYPFWQCAVEHNCLTHTKHAKMTPELATDMSCGRSMVLYSCVSFWLLAHESRDISQAETKTILITSWAN